MAKIKAALWSVITGVFGALGYVIFPKRPNHHYVLDVYGRKAFKQIDVREITEFRQLADTVMSNKRTLLYYDRLYILYQCLVNVSRLAKNRSGAEVNMAEVGVFRGGTSYFIADAFERMQVKNVSVYSFDTFESHHTADVDAALDPHYEGNLDAFVDTDYESVKAYLSKFSNVSVYKGRVQENAHLIEQKQFFFAHLDVDVYEPTVFGLNFFNDRLVIGGIILVDDYGFTTCPGVKKAVDDFVEAHPNYVIFHHLTGQCVLTKIA